MKEVDKGMEADPLAAVVHLVLQCLPLPARASKYSSKKKEIKKEKKTKKVKRSSRSSNYDIESDKRKAVAKREVK